MKNNDDKCFKWVIARATHPVPKHAERISKALRKQAEELSWYGMEFPTPCSSNVFKMFEKNNNISILVFGHEGEGKDLRIVPLRVPDFLVVIRWLAK